MHRIDAETGRNLWDEPAEVIGHQLTIWQSEDLLCLRWVTRVRKFLSRKEKTLPGQLDLIPKE